MVTDLTTGDGGIATAFVVAFILGMILVFFQER